MTIPIDQLLKTHNTAESRWARFGPYYAMFPIDFVFDVIEKYSKEGDRIIDPFAGRCSSVYIGSVLGRIGLGIEINPIGWLYGHIKLNPADESDVVTRLLDICNMKDKYGNELNCLPEFYRICYCDEVLKFLLCARKKLNWKYNNVDATLMSIILVHLHAKIGGGLSNQMRMTKSMGMNYSVQWWKSMGMEKPPEVNPYEFILKKIKWRYGKGKPKVTDDSKVMWGDSTKLLPQIMNDYKEGNTKYSLLFTSPPYHSITNYHADQWLRLWLLGYSEVFQPPKRKHTGRFVDKQEYYNLLDTVFLHCSQMMNIESTVYVRTDKRTFTFETTREILKKHFPKHDMLVIEKPITTETMTQTKLFGDKSLKPGEVDIIMSR